MTRVRSLLVVVVSLLVLHGSAFGQAPALSVVNTGPEGPLASLAQANEIRDRLLGADGGAGPDPGAARERCRS